MDCFLSFNMPVIMLSLPVVAFLLAVVLVLMLWISDAVCLLVVSIVAQQQMKPSITEPPMKHLHAERSIVQS